MVLGRWSLDVAGCLVDPAPPAAAVTALLRAARPRRRSSDPVEGSFCWPALGDWWLEVSAGTDA